VTESTERARQTDRHTETHRESETDRQRERKVERENLSILWNTVDVVHRRDTFFGSKPVSHATEYIWLQRNKTSSASIIARTSLAFGARFTVALLTSFHSDYIVLLILPVHWPAMNEGKAAAGQMTVSSTARWTAWQLGPTDRLLRTFQWTVLLNESFSNGLWWRLNNRTWSFECSV